jgi:hypothetical protein
MNKTLVTAITTASLGLSPSVMADLTTGLAAHYTFDNCTAIDSSGNNNNGAITGTLQCIGGKDGNALQFDGVSYIKVPSSPSLNPAKEWTMAFWVRVDGITNQWSPFIHKGGGLDLGCYANREYSVWLNSAPYFHQDSAGLGSCENYVDSKTIPLHRWMHYVGVIDRNKHVTKIYINGFLNVKKADKLNGFNKNNFDLRIGYSEEVHSSNSPFKGALDDIRFYNRVLSDTEILTLSNKGQPLGGRVNSLQQFSVTCTNITTGLTKTIPLKSDTVFWNCANAGLESSQGDVIDIHLNGISW